MTIFAVEYVPPAGFGELIANAFYIAGFIAAIAHVVNLFRAKPPLTEQLETLKKWMEERFVTSEAHEHLERRITRLETQLNGSVEELKTEVRRVHSRLDRNTEALGHFGGYMRGKLSKSGPLPRRPEGE